MLAQGVLPWPRALHVGGDGDRARQEGPEEIRDRQAAHQGVKSGLLLLLARFAKDHDGDDVAHHPENEHNGRDGGDHGPPRHRLVVHGEVGELTGLFLFVKSRTLRRSQRHPEERLAPCG